MATLLQSNSKSAGAVTSSTLAFTSNVTAGSLLVAHVSQASTTTTLGASDNLNGTYTQAVALGGTNVSGGMFFFPNSVGGAATVTFTGTGGNTLQVVIEEYSGSVAFSSGGFNDDVGFSANPSFFNFSESGSAGVANFGRNFPSPTIKGQWVEFDAWYYAASDSTGRIRMHTNNAVNFDVYNGLVHNSSTLTVHWTLDTFTNRTTRKWSIGSYNRAWGGANQFRYFAELYQDFGEGWLYITNSPTWGAETTGRAIQPYTSWSDGSISFTVNGGTVPAGTVYAHVRMAPWKTSGHQVFGPYTLSG